MKATIIGDWGHDLPDDRDFAIALAALGVLEATGTAQHRASSDPEHIAAALRDEIQNGERTPIWRGAESDFSITKSEYWQSTSHGDTAALVEAWKRLVRTGHPRFHPRLAIRAAWRRSALIDLESIIGLLKQAEGLEALIIVPDDADERPTRTIWHWPVRVGVPVGRRGDLLVRAFERVSVGWIETLTRLVRVGGARDACDLLIPHSIGFSGNVLSHS